MTYKDLTFQKERSLYNIKDSKVINCKFQGEEDGESPLKECKNIVVEECDLNLRYPFWHNENVRISNCNLKENCRAPMWYCNDFTIHDCNLNCVKAVRECKNVKVYRKSPHKIRKTYGTMLMDSKVDERFIINQMGHTDILCSETHYHRDRKSVELKKSLLSQVPEFKCM